MNERERERERESFIKANRLLLEVDRYIPLLNHLFAHFIFV